MKKFIKVLDEKLDLYFLIITLVIMVLLTVVQVFLRAFFKYSLIWAEELTRYIMLYQIWIGAAFAVKEGNHIRITTLVDKLSPKNKIKIEILITLLWIIFAVFLTINSAQLVKIILDKGQLSPAMQIPMGYAYASVPIGCGIMAIRLIQKLYNETKKLENQEV